MTAREKRIAALVLLSVPLVTVALVFWAFTRRSTWQAVLDANVHLVGMAVVPLLIVVVLYIRDWRSRRPGLSTGRSTKDWTRRI
jgi:hypothetical protein